jgi:hypothetical protein
MNFTRSLGLAAALVVMATPLVTLADPPKALVDQQAMQRMFPNAGNDAAQGRFYNDNDYWLDPRTGSPVPSAPTVKDYGGGGGGF